LKAGRIRPYFFYAGVFNDSEALWQLGHFYAQAIVQAGIGKASFSETEILDNIKAFLEAVRKARPSGAKGTYMRHITLSSTMGLGVRIDASTISA